jgi:hypothetical protein
VAIKINSIEMTNPFSSPDNLHKVDIPNLPPANCAKIQHACWLAKKNVRIPQIALSVRMVATIELETPADPLMRGGDFVVVHE